MCTGTKRTILILLCICFLSSCNKSEPIPNETWFQGYEGRIPVLDMPIYVKADGEALRDILEGNYAHMMSEIVMYRDTLTDESLFA